MLSWLPVQLRAVIRSFLRRNDGPTSVEYAVMLALIIVVCTGAITVMVQNLPQTFHHTGGKLEHVEEFIHEHRD